MDISIQEAAAQMEQLIERLGAGERITLTRDGQPVAELVPLRKRLAERAMEGDHRDPDADGWSPSEDDAGMEEWLHHQHH